MADPTIGDLFKAKTITDDEVNAAVDVFMRDATAGLFRFASGHTLDLAATVRAHEPARLAVVDPDRNEKFRRKMVRTAILLAWPTGAVIDDIPSVGGRALEALRAVAVCPRGMRLTAYPRLMRKLIELGYAVERQALWEGARPDEIGRFITPAGRELIAALGTGIIDRANERARRG